MDNVLNNSRFSMVSNSSIRFSNMTELMSSGIELMIAGMAIVFLFLTMLVCAINLMSFIVQRFFPEAPTTAVHVSTGGVDKQVIAAITAAVHQYRSQHK
jgi:oxaloacetate decarboxylase (Na+ extruding) subunit gamma